MIKLWKTFSWLTTILLPLALTLLGIRLLLTHTYLEIEYRMPGFPPDDYGFNLQDRLHWSEISWDFMLNSADISFLADLNFPDGSALFNERELSHMQDVKNVVRPALWAGYGIWLVLLGLGLWSWYKGWWKEFVAGLRRGGWLTAGLVVGLGLIAALSFWQFFTVFHELFFKGDSWLFYYSDTLIRLFPMRFWQDAFLFVGMLDLLGGLGLAFTLPGAPREPGQAGGLRPHARKGVYSK
jgi:integral membrane protein (TIGR01906 family)